MTWGEMGKGRIGTSPAYERVAAKVSAREKLSTTLLSREREREREREKEREKVSWCFEPSLPQRITSGLERERERERAVSYTHLTLPTT